MRAAMAEVSLGEGERMMEEDVAASAAPLGVAVIDKSPLVRRGLCQRLR